MGSVVAGGTQVGVAVGSWGGSFGSHGGRAVDVSDGDGDGVEVPGPEVSVVVVAGSEGGGSEGVGWVGVGSGVAEVVEPELVEPELLVAVSEDVGAGSDEDEGAVLVVSGVAFGLEGVVEVGDEVAVPESVAAGTAAPVVEDAVPEAVGVTAPGVAGGPALAAAAAA
ncbi:MAG TPA: hypothetical protein VK204_12145 [Nocardioidaceae bacterium]|nr:hypothetical protein [Nocardioidaceae bacterium]